MKNVLFSFSNALVPSKEIFRLRGKLENEISRMNKASKLGYDDLRASINLSKDKKMLKEVNKMVKSKLRLKPDYLVVIGIGGSNLGTIAVQEAVLSKYYNYRSKMKVFYADTVDADSIKNIMCVLERGLKRGKRVLVNVVTKSGGTTETVANFQVLFKLLKKYKVNHKKFVVVTTGEGSKLYNLAKKEEFDILTIPEKVGGRYSVLSPVGLFPLGVMGVDTSKLLKGAANMLKQCLRTVKDNPAVMSALIQYHHFKNSKSISAMFMYSNDLESLGKWYRQLMGESIGKEHDVNGKKVFTGITPIVSVGSTDLHSMAQLYLGGPYDKMFTLLSVNNVENVKVPDLGYDLVEDIGGKSLSDIMGAIHKGFGAALKKGKRPFMEVMLPDKSEASVGQFLQFKMMEIMYLGSLLNVNPFDQPNVENYKIETKKILKN